MSGYRTSPCRACGEPMVWTVTSRGKKMPVDAEPGGAGGSFELAEREGVVHADFVAPEARGGRDLYTPHHVTCPHADQFRGRK